VFKAENSNFYSGTNTWKQGRSWIWPVQLVYRDRYR